MASSAPASLIPSRNYSYCEKIGIAPCLRRAEMPVRLGLRKDLGHDSACPSTFRYKSGRGGWIWRTWFRHSRARLDFGRAHYIRNRDFRANFQIGRTFCRGRIDINFEFLRALLHCHHAARGGYHRPSDLISLRPGGECYSAKDQIRSRDQAKCHFHFHAVNYEPPWARRKILGDIAEPSEAGQLLQCIRSKLNRSSNRTKRSWATQLIVQSAAFGAKRVDLHADCARIFPI